MNLTNVLLIITISLLLLGIGLGAAFFVFVRHRFNFMEVKLPNYDDYELLHTQASNALLAISENAEVLDDIFQKVEKISDVSADVDNLKKGLVPDYEEARKATESVNGFFTSVNSVMGYNPYAEQAKRKQERGVDDE